MSSQHLNKNYLHSAKFVEHVSLTLGLLTFCLFPEDNSNYLPRNGAFKVISDNTPMSRVFTSIMTMSGRDWIVLCLIVCVTDVWFCLTGPRRLDHQ